MKSSNQLARDAINTAKGLTGSITVDANSTTTRVYEFFSPICDVAAVVGADAQRVKYARSWLGSQGKYLDNVGREINTKRLREESDDSFRRNAPRIFTAGAAFDTCIDPDAVKEVNEQEADVQVRSVKQMFTQMRGRFSRLRGGTDIPFIMPRYWLASAFRLHEMYQHIANVVSNDITEDSEDIADTDWLYRSSALRVPGVLDAKVDMSDYNEIIIHVRLDDRLRRDARGVNYLVDEGKVLTDVRHLAQQYLPKPDHRTLKAPRLIVRTAQEKPVYVYATMTGPADIEDVRDAIDDYFYANRKIGVALPTGGVVAAAKATPGVSTFSMSSPDIDALQPAEFEILSLGQMDIVKIGLGT